MLFTLGKHYTIGSRDKNRVSKRREANTNQEGTRDNSDNRLQHKRQ